MNAVDYEKQISDDVACHGWHVCIIAADDVGPAFAYSIGLSKSFGHPEIIVFGLDDGKLGGDLHQLVNAVGELVKAGHSFGPGSRVDGILAGCPCEFRAVDRRHYETHFGCGCWFNGGPDFSALQLVWPDSLGHFPWDNSFETGFREVQPLLG